MYFLKTIINSDKEKNEKILGRIDETLRLISETNELMDKDLNEDEEIEDEEIEGEENEGDLDLNESNDDMEDLLNENDEENEEELNEEDLKEFNEAFADEFEQKKKSKKSKTNNKGNKQNNLKIYKHKIDSIFFRNGIYSPFVFNTYLYHN